MLHFVKLLALLSLLLLPVRIAEARAFQSPDAILAAIDLGHCSGGEADKQHGRSHVHCPMVGEILNEAAGIEARLPISRRLSAPLVRLGAPGLGPQAATPPPRAL